MAICWADRLFWLFLIVLVFAVRDICGIIQVELAIPGFVDKARNANALPFVGPVFELAVENCNRRYAGVFNFTSTYLYDANETAVTLLDTSIGYIAKWYYERRLDTTGIAVIMSPVALNSDQIHQLAASWNILYFQTTLFTQSSYRLPAAPVLATAVTSPPAYARTFVNLLKVFAWRTVFLVPDTTSPYFYQLLFNQLLPAMVSNPWFVVHVKTISPQNGNGSTWIYDSLLDDFRSKSRVMIYLGHPLHLRQFLVCAAKRNMTNGEYVYLTFGIHWSAPAAIFGELTWRSGDSDDTIAKSAFRSLIVVQAYLENTTVDTNQLLTEIRRRAALEFGITIQKSDQIIFDVLTCFATVTMLAQVFNESLQSAGAAQLRDARQLAPHFLQRTLRNGYSDMYLDRSGVRGARQAVTTFIGNDSQREIFLLERQGTYQFESLRNVSDHWPGGKWPPINEPLCGYGQNELSCSQSASFLNELIVPLIVVGVALLSAYLVHQAFSRNSSIPSTWWQLDSMALLVYTWAQHSSMRKTWSYVSVS